MINPNKQPDNSGELRWRAEQRLAVKQASHAEVVIDEKRLVHELQVHQIELEMQNEALREARLQSEIALERFTELFDFAPLAYFSLCCKGIIQQANFRSESLLAIERSALCGQNFAHWVTNVFQLLFKNFLAKVFANTDSHSCEMTLQIGNDQKWVRVEGIADKTGDSCLLAVSDISERKRNEQELQLAATVFLSLEEAIIVTDKDNRIVCINPAFTRLTGYLSDEAVGQTTALLKSVRHDKAFYEAMRHSLNTTGHWQGEIWTKRKNGEEFLESLSINTLCSQNGEVIRRIATATDITDKKRMEEILRHQAHFDQLTGLPNRFLFLDRLQRAINKSNRTGRQLALMFLDLDHFKDVNDSLGHDAGDELLKEATQRLKGCLRETDTLARPGGDEFTIILDELDEFSSIDRVAQHMVECMTAPFIVKKERCYISVSIGIALYPSDADNLEELLKKADQAMYVAKNQGRSRYCYFMPAMQEASAMRLRLGNDLRHALTDRQLSLFYQPIVDFASGRIQKAEALIRWQHPTRGWIHPLDFIAVSEDNGMITEIDEWVFHQAVDQVAIWRANYRADFQISINTSSAQFQNNGIKLNEWFVYLQDRGLSGDCIAVEITEGLLLNATAIVSEKLLEFRDAGIQVSLDDYGTGNSSLYSLKKYDIDYLKIDRSFVASLTADSNELVLCEAMILLAHKLDMKIIAEGIETQEQFDLLRQAGCDYGQGNLFSKAVSADEFEKLLLTE